PRLRPLLQAGPLPAASAGGVGDLGRRHVVPWRPRGGAGRLRHLRAAARRALPRSHGLRGTAGAARARGRTDGELHQRRALGTRLAPAVGDGVSAVRERRAATSVPALPVPGRGVAALCRAVVVLLAAADKRRGLRSL